VTKPNNAILIHLGSKTLTLSMRMKTRMNFHSLKSRLGNVFRYTQSTHIAYELKLRVIQTLLTWTL